MNTNFVVYTALFGDYDDLVEPKEKYKGCDFICFTNNKHFTSDIWQIRLIEECDLPPNMMNRRYKIFPHLYLSEYDWSLYVDTNIAITGNPLDLALKYLSKYDMALPRHFARNCIYKEAKECYILGKAKYSAIIKQINNYKHIGFPKNFGLSENGIILRKHNRENVIKIMNDWWKELNSFTKRDQLSLAYVLWKNDEKFNFMEESARNGSGYFKYISHNEFKNRSVLLKAKDKIKITFKRFLSCCLIKI